MSAINGSRNSGSRRRTSDSDRRGPGNDCIDVVKYGLYEDPHTHRFALLPLPDRFVDDDRVAVSSTARWFDSRDAAVAAVAELLDTEDRDSGPPPDDAVPVSGSNHPH